ncbi:MAG: TIM barrel protein [Spirochaetaceae bacterium]|nr:TIM barrel protein [Spirochaetaceae bacterium]
MEPAICIEMLYPGMSPQEKIRKTAQHGFRNIEFWGCGDKNLDALEQLRQLPWQVRYVNFSGQRVGDLIDASTHQVLLQDIAGTVPVARRLGTKTLMILSNELGEGGRVVHPCQEIPDKIKHENLVTGLRKVMQIIPEDMTIVIEPLNTVLDHPGYFLTHIEDTLEIISEVGDRRLKVLCDFYHLALMGENPVDIAQRFAGSIGHIHIADYPGRNEPGTGRGDWRKVLMALHDNHYEGYVGFEFSPSENSDDALEAVAMLWKEAFGEKSLSRIF